jgi:hypothetical protein
MQMLNSFNLLSVTDHISMHTCKSLTGIKSILFSRSILFPFLMSNLKISYIFYNMSMECSVWPVSGTLKIPWGMRTVKVIGPTFYNFLELFPSPKSNGSRILSAGKQGRWAGGGTWKDPSRAGETEFFSASVNLNFLSQTSGSFSILRRTEPNRSDGQ